MQQTQCAINGVCYQAGIIRNHEAALFSFCNPFASGLSRKENHDQCGSLGGKGQIHKAVLWLPNAHRGRCVPDTDCEFSHI